MQKFDEELTGERLNTLIRENGAAEATARLYEEHNTSFLAAIVSYLDKKGCADPSVHAEDVTSRAYIAVQKDFEKYESKEKTTDYTSPLGFLIAVGINLSNKHLRRDIKMERLFTPPSTRSGEARDDELDYQKYKNGNIDIFREITENSPEANVIKKEIRVFVDNFILQFPQIQQAAFNLYFYEGYSHKEIGDLLNISEANSRQHVSRMVRKIKPHVKRLFGGLE